MGRDAFPLYVSALHTSHGERLMELQSAGPGRLAKQLLGAVELRGGSLDFLTNAKVSQELDDLSAAYRSDPGVQLLASTRATVYDAAYMHSKVFAAFDASGRPSAVIGNVTPRSHSDQREDFTVEIFDHLAEAQGNVLRQSISGAGSPRARAAIEHARALDLLWDDPASDVRHLTNGRLDALRGAEQTWFEVTKGIESPEYVEALVAARDRGVRLGVATRSIAESARARLSEADVPVVVLPRTSSNMRMNVAIADNERAILGTTYPAPSMQSRDSGIVLRGADARRTTELLRRTSAGGIADGALRSGTAFGSSPLSGQLVRDVHAGSLGWVQFVE